MVIDPAARLDEDPGNVAGGVEVGLAHQRLGQRLHIVMDQPEQPDAGEQHEEALGAFEQRDGPGGGGRFHDGGEVRLGGSFPGGSVPELPDVVVYIERLTPLVLGQPLVQVRLGSPFVLRTVDPPISEVQGRTVTGIRRLGKRIVLALEGDLFLVIHLMIAGRLRWRVPGKSLRGKMVLAEFGFPDGTLYLTEAGSKRRASIHVVQGEAALAAFERGGLEVLSASARPSSARASAARTTRSSARSPTPGS